MARRRGNSVSISLFAFQDIITSVCGILLFITLLLAVELSQRQDGRPDLPIERVSEDLVRAVDEAKIERDRLVRTTQQQAATLTLAADRSLDEVEREVRSLSGTIGGRERDLEELRQRREHTERRQIESESREPQRSDLDLRRHALEARVKILEQELQEAREQDRVVLDITGVPGGSGWVVDLGTDQIQVAPIETAAPPRTFRPGLAVIGTSAEQQLLTWLDAEAPGQYVLLLVRPGAQDRFDTLESHCKSTGRPYGFDLIGSRQTVFDPQRGVYRP